MRLEIKAVFLPLLLVPGIALADTLILSTGRQMEGEVVEEKDSQIVFRLRSGSEITLPISTIQEVVRSSAAENDLIKADSLFERGAYEEALAAYRLAAASEPSRAREKIRAIENLLASDLDRRLESLNPEEREDLIRVEMSRMENGDPARRPYEIRLAEILHRKGESAFRYMQYAKASELLEEAWTLAPDLPGLGPTYLKALENANASPRKAEEVMREYLDWHPEDRAAAGVLASKTWKQDPWEALNLLLPDGVFLPDASGTDSNLLVNVLQACFESEREPLGAPLDRIGCHELYQELRPDADRSAYYRLLLETDPDNPDLHFEWGQYLEERGETKESLEVYRRLQSLDPLFPNVRTKVRELEEKILEQEVKTLEKEVEDLEVLYHQVRSLGPRDFPLIGEGPVSEQLADRGRKLSTILNERPPAGEAEVKKYLSSLGEYKARLSNLDSRREARGILLNAPKSGLRAQIGDAAPLLVGRAVDGREVDLSKSRGSLVAIYFWATWCPACRQNVSNMVEIEKVFQPPQVQVISISLDKKREDLTRFLEVSPGLKGPQIYMGGGWENPAAGIFGITSIPQAVLIDENGTVMEKDIPGHELFLALSKAASTPNKANVAEE
jgi:tetratricopeptide (TPR) repeat protein/thiol-disulfide isomerase/thioredoxin